MSGAAAGATGSLQLTVERWSTPEERKAYIEAMLEGKNEKNLEAKQRKLLSMMEDARGDKRNGFARFPRALGWDLTYAWQFMQGSTRVVRLATNLPIAFVQARNSYRTMDYPFGLDHRSVLARLPSSGDIVSSLLGPALRMRPLYPARRSRHRRSGRSILGLFDEADRCRLRCGRSLHEWQGVDGLVRESATHRSCREKPYRRPSGGPTRGRVEHRFKVKRALRTMAPLRNQSRPHRGLKPEGPK